MLLAANKAQKSYSSHYYYFQQGSAIGSFLGLGLTTADRLLKLGLITPIDPWKRFVP